MSNIDFIHVIRWDLEIIEKLLHVPTRYEEVGTETVRVFIGDDMEFGAPRYMASFLSGILRGIRLKQAADYMSAEKGNGNV